MPPIQRAMQLVARWQAMHVVQNGAWMPVAQNFRSVDPSALLDPPPSFGSSASEEDEEIADEEGGEEGHYEEDEEMADEEATGEATDEPEQRSPPATTPKKRLGL